MKSKTFGLDIGDKFIKAVWLDVEENTSSLLSCVVLPTPVHGMASESPLDHEEMAQTLKQILDEGKITIKAANVALADNQVFTKVIEMPILSEKELASAIKWEAEQYIPQALSTMTLDNIVLKEVQTENGPRMLVLLVAAPTALITKYQRIFNLAGLSLASVETEILSVVRSVPSEPTSPTSFFMHIGSLSTSFAIMQQGSIIFTYSIPVGSVAIDRAISSAFGFSASQAEEYKKTYGIEGDTISGKIGNAISPILLSIASETKKALAFYKDKYHNEFPVEQLILSGGTSSMPGITKYFAAQCSIETSTIDPFTANQIANVPEEIKVNASEFGTAVGLALKSNE